MLRRSAGSNAWDATVRLLVTATNSVVALVIEILERS